MKECDKRKKKPHKQQTSYLIVHKPVSLLNEDTVCFTEILELSF